MFQNKAFFEGKFCSLENFTHIYPRDFVGIFVLDTPRTRNVATAILRLMTESRNPEFVQTNVGLGEKSSCRKILNYLSSVINIVLCYFLFFYQRKITLQSKTGLPWS